MKIFTFPSFWLLNLLSVVVIISSAYADMGQAYRDAEKLTHAEKLKRASQHLTQMQSTLNFTLQKLQTAFDKKDIIQTNCVRDKLSTVKGLLRISEEADVGLREAVVTGQSNLITHEYVKISMAAERVQISRTQIEGCAGNVDDPLTSTNQDRVKPEIFDESVQAFTPTSDERTVIVYEPIASERPEAISASE